ncbi:DNA polymerase III subunit gamma/tau [Testudinibacter sp. TR-2022]|uniref:DNA polymerase III subunit gamma/tau n=1 Tax=Testudinibacter sp. TR-2022 TaxID=2585029 RepID=UPI00111BA8E7|nr:DNA polymerase III subunit gamma/tau [Testudinibacter sp. TR-2022]TNH05829.1 DNA polymerase III subunit gamma/tau [Pasteurellaceae bacterium Phil31]TNH07350.1 DNA polymerase III subunit gamma/tau [Testudinibacter sp. TR-2022]TNH10689.1 DNA polymerase III subunit gamma/tau [Testudinibacter sp. TR-2022]TNH14311.1 DNA polymerase III subunit gamma/tau [Testudinibacter sp. TR-2022]TNH16385.1 DNA polymerase III subunit gamma/tau [Testudinibacter sp. TR-2022]
MSYQVLARKWRPQRFSQVVGQQHVLTALANGLDSNRLHHAYLFSGTRGVGKTSIARLFAKGLNCEHGVSAAPCGECENCRAIEEGRFIDLLEIDAASRTKVEDTRELLDNVQYKPVQGRYKIYLIDEVHMLSRHSFNALLKTLEEPPEYVKFLLATTDPHKLPVTILSRCIQFHLKALEPQQIADHLEHILQQEKIAYQRNALDQIAKAARGSIRDALSLTDQAIAMGNSNISREIVHQMLGTLDGEQALDIIQALQLADGEAVMQALRQVAEKGIAWDQLLQEIAAYLHQIAMRQLLKPTSDTAEQENRIDFLASHLPPEDVQYYYQLMLSGRKELPYAPDQRSGVEMTLLRALAFHPKLLQWEQANTQTTTEHDNHGEKAENTHQHVEKIRQNFIKHDVPQQQPLSVPDVTSAVKTELQTQLTPQPIVQPEIENQVQPERLEAQSAVAENAAPQSSALKALRARDQLRQNTQKKNPELATGDVARQESARESGAKQPFITAAPAKSLKIMERLSQISESSADSARCESQPPLMQSEAIEDDEPKNDAETETIGEDYHWQWLNPELEQEELGNRLRPSDIKQAILQERTPELVAKVLRISAERDHWSALIEKLNVSGMVKQLGLNSLLLQEEKQAVVLGLRPEQSNLNNERYINILEQQLSEFYQRKVRLEVCLEADQTRMTPLEQRRQVYLELGEQAKQALQQDPQLALLQQEFDALLDLESIRAVG